MADKQERSKTKASTKATPKKKALTVRERAAKASEEKPKRIRKAAGSVKTPLRKIGKVKGLGDRIPVPDNKFGRLMKKRVRIVPKFIREAFQEIRLVVWPDTRTTVRLTLAVFIFAVVFAGFVGALDYALGQAFKHLFIKN